MTEDQYKFVKDRLDFMRKAPGMWAICKEAYVAQVALLLEIMGYDPDFPHLYMKLMNRVNTGPVFKDALEEVNIDFAQTVVDNALEILNNLKQKSNV